MKLKNQKGMTFIEMLLVIALVGTLASVISPAIFQVVKGTNYYDDRVIAIRQLQNAGYWISLDVQRAQNVVTGDNPATPQIEFLSLSWIEWSNGTMHSSTYTFEPMSSGEIKKLKRNFNGKKMLVAQYINAATSSCLLDEELLIVILSVKVNNVEETRKYGVTPRTNL